MALQDSGADEVALGFVVDEGGEGCCAPVGLGWRWVSHGKGFHRPGVEGGSRAFALSWLLLRFPWRDEPFKAVGSKLLIPCHSL